jgi:hypothetical protein
MSNIDEEERGSEPHKPFCPKCGSTDIRESQSHRTMDFLLKSFSLRPHRCRSCRKRFYLRKPDQPEIELTGQAGPEHEDPADSNANS